MVSSGCEYEGCTLDDELDPNDTYIDNNNSPVLADPMLLEQYPGDITAGELAFTAVGLATAGTAPTLIEGAVGILWPAVAGGGSAVCADGDCTNEVSELPKLSEKIASAFKNNAYTTKSLKAGDLLYRAETASATDPGYWFGTQMTQSAARAERWWNIVKWGNQVEVLRGYKVLQDITVYYGEVAGGRGTQILFPHNLDLSQLVQRVAEYPLR